MQLITVQQSFNNYCDNNLCFCIEDMSYCSSLAICALDAVMSIRLKYNSVVIPRVDSLCNMISIHRLAHDRNHKPKDSEETSITAFMSKLESLGLWSEEGLCSIIGTFRTAGYRQYTTTKAKAFIDFINVLRTHRIDTYQDFARYEEKDKLYEDLRLIKGQKASVDYFFMLAGDQDRIKVDVHIKRFTERATGINNLSIEDIRSLFKNAAEYFSKKGLKMTPRHLDHIVWTFQTSN